MNKPELNEERERAARDFRAWNGMELASDLADMVVESRIGPTRWVMAGNDERYTEEAQAIFNEYYEAFHGRITRGH